MKPAKHQVSNLYVEQVREMVLAKLAGLQVKVYLFGSRATGKACETADIDVAIEPFEALPIGLLSDIREQLEESNIPFPVDLVDLSSASEKLAAMVRQEGILWKDCKPD